MRRTDIRAGEYGHGPRGELTIDRPGTAAGDEPATTEGSGDAAHDDPRTPAPAAGSDPSAGPTGPVTLVHPAGTTEPAAAAGGTGTGDRAAPDAGGPAPAVVPGPPGGVLSPPAVVPGPPGGVLDLRALAAVEDRLRALAHAAVDHTATTGARGPRDSEADRVMSEAASTIATALWFDTLRAEDRVSVTPHAAPLLGAVHHVLRSAFDDGNAPPGDGAPGTPLDAGPHAMPPAGTMPPARTGPAAGAIDPAVAGRPGPAARPPSTGRSPRVTGAGNVGPNGTIWSALAGRYAGERFDRAPHGRQICLIDFAELRDSAVWEAVTDERVSHLGELFWVVLVTGTTPAGTAGPAGSPVSAGPAGSPGGIGGPARAARMFEAAGWQVLTLRYGRRIAALFHAPGGAALRARLDAMHPAEYQALLLLDGPELRRRLAGPGAAGVGVSRLLDTLTDDQIQDALRDLGGHDLPLIIDAFDEVDPGRPTVLFAYTGPLAGPARAPRTGPGAGGDVAAARATGDAGAPSPSPDPGGVGRGPVVLRADPSSGLLPAGSPAARLARHVATYLDRSPLPLNHPPAVPVDAGRAHHGWRSTQEVFGATLRDLPDLAPLAAAAVVTISTRDADHVLTGWIDAAAPGSNLVLARPSIDRVAASRTAAGSPAGRPDDTIADGTIADGSDRAVLTASPGGGLPANPAPHGEGAGGGGEGGSGTGGAEAGAGRSPGGRHVAGGLSASAFGGVLASLGVAWSRLGLPLLPIGVADELAAGRVLPGWAAGGTADARSLLAVADTGLDPTRPGGWRHGSVGVPGIACWEPAFAQDLVWCLLEALGRMGRMEGSSSVIRLSARPVDQRLAAVPTDPAGWWRRRAAVLAGGYRLRDGEPSVPLTLVGMGPVIPEVLRAADELSAGLRREIGVVCVTSPDLLFEALQARRGLAAGSDAILTELFPASRRGPLLTVVDGDPRVLGFLAGVHGEHISTLGSAAPPPGEVSPGAGAGRSAGDGGYHGPVNVSTIVGAALDLVDETASS